MRTYPIFHFKFDGEGFPEYRIAAVSLHQAKKRAAKDFSGMGNWVREPQLVRELRAVHLTFFERVWP